MPGTTPIYGLRYLELGDPPDIPKVGKDLGTDVETELDRIDTALSAAETDIAVLELVAAHLGDTGWTTVATASAWSGNLNARKKDGIAYLSGPVTKVGTLSTAGATSTIVTALTASLQPTLQIECLGNVFLNGTSNQRGTFVIRVTTGGAVQVFVTTESGSLPDTGQLRFSVAYPAG